MVGTRLDVLEARLADVDAGVNRILALLDPRPGQRAPHDYESILAGGTERDDTRG